MIFNFFFWTIIFSHSTNCYGFFNIEMPNIKKIWNWEYCTLNENFYDTLRTSLEKEVFGQDIAVNNALLAVKSHLHDKEPRHALSMVLMGSTGTGKNFLSTLLGQAVFSGSQDYVHTYSGRLAFPVQSQAETYMVRLQDDITKSIQYCERSVFIFDEIDKMPAGVIDAVKPFLDYHTSIKKVDYRKAIFIFLTNVGGLEINSKYRTLRETGMSRHDMKYNHFEKIIRQNLFHSEGLFENSVIIADHLISAYLPFLPMQKSHVIQCIKREMERRNKIPTEFTIRQVLNKMDFHNDEFSVSGCKRVVDHVSAVQFTSSHGEL